MLQKELTWRHTFFASLAIQTLSDLRSFNLHNYKLKAILRNERNERMKFFKLAPNFAVRPCQRIERNAQIPYWSKMPGRVLTL